MIEFLIDRYGDKWYWTAGWEQGDDVLFESGGHATRAEAIAELERVIESCRTGAYLIEDTVR